MGRSFDLVQEPRDVVDIKPFAKPKLYGANPERLGRGIGTCVESRADRVVNDGPERPTAATNLELKP